MSTITTRLPAVYLPSIDAKPFLQTKVTVTEIHNESPPETAPQSPTIASIKYHSQSPLGFLSFALETEHFRLSFEILNVLERYGRHVNPKTPTNNSSTGCGSNPSTWIGKPKFLAHVYHYVQQAQPIQLTMPAFPCKSLNRVNKVLGHLPDLGEELALCRLHAMGEDIQKVYTPGAMISIASDGILFNDILGITDEDTWEYGEALRAIIRDRGLTTLKFTYCMALLNLISEENITKETYMSTVGTCRQNLDNQYAPTEAALTAQIKNDKDTSLTYCGMVIFLQSEMETSPELIGLGSSAKIRLYKKRAKKMMQRSEAFTLAIRTLKPMNVRLSMHPSSGVNKLSFPLIPTREGDFQRSPWHSCVAVGVDGEYRCVHSEDVRESHDLVYQDGRPYFYRERSETS